MKTMTRHWRAAPAQPSGELARRVSRRFPREALLDGPTPLQFVPRFSAAIGAEVYVKRDDHGSLTVAGAKARKLERIIAQARAGGYRTLLTAGPAQSNTTRAIASACAVTGLRAELLLRAEENEPLQGNALISKLTGAQVHRCGMLPWTRMEALAAARAQQDASTYLVPMGGTSAGGVAGMLAGYLEMQDQLAAQSVSATAVYHASATGGIWAGLALGAATTSGPRPRPVAVIRDVYPDMPARYAQIFNEAADSLSLPARMTRGAVQLDFSQLGADYGEPTDAALEAIGLMMRTEGILCDYVYTGKALAALVADARAGRLAGPVVFWHSGGLPGMMTSDAMDRLGATASC